MNRFLFYFVWLIFTTTEAKQIYLNDKLIRVQAETLKQIEYLQNLEQTTTIDFWSEIIGFNQTIDLHLKANDFENYRSQFEQISLTYKILSNNLQELIDSEQKQIQFDRLKRQWTDHRFRSIVGTYASYDEMIDYMQEKQNLYPKYVQVIELGRTFENRPMKGLVLQFNPFTKRNIWIDCGIHARGKYDDLDDICD